MWQFSPLSFICRPVRHDSYSNGAGDPADVGLYVRAHAGEDLNYEDGTPRAIANVVHTSMRLRALRKVCLISCYGGRNDPQPWEAPTLRMTDYQSRFSTYIEAVCAELGARGYNEIKGAAWTSFVDIHKRSDHFISSRKDASLHGKKILNYPLDSGVAGVRRGRTRQVVTREYRDKWKRYFAWSRDAGIREIGSAEWHDASWDDEVAGNSTSYAASGSSVPPAPPPEHHAAPPGPLLRPAPAATHDARLAAQYFGQPFAPYYNPPPAAPLQVGPTCVHRNRGWCPAGCFGH